MKIDLLVVSGRTLDTKPCILIQCENSYYVFNFPDQTQRVFMEYKWKMLKIKEIFLTDTSSSSIGGLPGMILTTYTGEKSPFGFTAPENFPEILRQQILYHNVPDAFPDISSAEYSDAFLRVTPIKLLSTIAYSVKLCDEPGKFDVLKAKELGLKPGPLFKKLTQGESVTLDDGTVIEPSMCVGKPIPGAKILIIDIKQEEEIDILVQKFQGDNDLSSYDIIVHYTHPHLFNLDKYQSIFTESSSQFAKNNKKQKQIQFCFQYSDQVTFRSSYKLYTDVTSKRLLLSSPEKDAPKLKDCFTNGEIGLNYSIVPSNKRKLTNIAPDKTKIDKSIPFDYELPKIESFGVTFFGTGCNMPTKLRNVAGILIHLKEGYVVFDAGEGFVGQLYRRFGRENGEEVIKKLLFVFTSHSHGDHVFGLHQLLETHQQLTERRIPILADQQIIDDLKSRGDFNVDYKNREEKNYELNENGCELILNSFPVEHLEGSHGCVLTIENKWRIAYSGDHSVVKDDFVEKVGKCDLLIHEASFSDDMENEALDRNHSTIGQAIDAGKKLSAKFIALTHFSARYKLENCNISSENILFAFDFLSFTFENAESTCEKCKNAFLEILKENADEEQ